MNRINKIIRKPLSDADLKRILGSETRIITYPDLAKYNNLDELLPKAYDFVIILLLESPQSGHWCCLIKNPSQFEWFDSYGFAPDYDLTHWLTPLQRLKLGESKKYLSYLLKGRNYIYNKVKYQQMKPNINTCGSHVAYRCYKFKTAGYNLKDYQQHVYNACKVNGLTPDELVAKFVSSML